jgi:uncharacterized protein (TIRG00374 family)
LNKRLKKLLQTLLFFSTGAIILYIVYYKYNQAYIADCALKGIASEDCSLVKKVYEDFLRSNFLILFLVLIFFMLSNISRALRWNMLLNTFGVKPKMYNSFFSIMLGYFANLGLPRIGEVIRAATLARYEKTKMDKVMGTVILDRVMDVILMLIFILIALVLSYTKLVGFLQENSNFSEKLSELLKSPLVIGGALSLVIVVILLFRSSRIRNSTIGLKVRGFIIGMYEGLKSISALKRPWLFVFHSVFIWMMYFLMLYVGFFAFEPTSGLSLEAGIVVFTLGGIGFVIPSPGGMGTYHFLISAGLVLYGVSGVDGFSFANIMFFTIQIFANILFGLLALILLPLLNAKQENA